MTDTLRMVIMQVVNNFFGVLLALNLFPDLDTQKIGVIEVFIGSTLLLVAYFWKSGQSNAN